MDRAPLIAALRSHRLHVLGTLDGLSTQQMTAVHAPVTWSMAAVVHHLAIDVERWWFQAVVDDDSEAWSHFDTHPDGAWSVPDGTDVIDRYRVECERSDQVIARTDLDAVPPHWPENLGAPQSLGQVIIHVIGETAAHAGHLDIVRESIDGARWLVLD